MIESQGPIDADATEIDALADPAESCAVCSAVPVGERYVLEQSASLAVFCSEPCLRAGVRAYRRRRWAARRRGAAQVGAVVIFAGACLTPHEGPTAAHAGRPPRKPALAPAGPPPLPAGWFGPDWPPTEPSLLAALGRDAWIHPLSGPFRRMPLRDSRVFGAARPGNRAVECRNGHCGVDLGGEIWGEHVHAVHDGVVEWIQRGANPQHGGQYVRIAHRGGSVITQYFHLAAIPRELERGTPVKGGDVIGLLGDTGVKESAPHLHFSISIRTTPERPEKYFDPEPLVALWPLRVPVDGTAVGLVTTTARPGVPLGSAPVSAGRRRKLARHGAAAADVADGETAAPSRDEPSAPAETEGSPESSPDE